MLIGMFEEEKPKGSGEKLPSIPLEQATIITGIRRENICKRMLY